MRFDENRMVITVDLEDDDGEEYEQELPVKYVVCGTCDGKGSHVNPAIDGHGISPEEFAEDPDFAEDYFDGVYDMPCEECHGKRVVPEIDYEAIPKDEKMQDALRHLEARERADADYKRECAMERRMGA